MYLDLSTLEELGILSRLSGHSRPNKGFVKALRLDRCQYFVRCNGTIPTLSDASCSSRFEMLTGSTLT